MTWFDRDHLTGQGEKLDSKVSASPLAKASARREKSYFQEKSHVRKPALQFSLLLGEAGIWSQTRVAKSEVNPCFLPLRTRQSQRYINYNPRASSYRGLNGKSLEHGHHPNDPLKSTGIGNTAPLWAFANHPINLHWIFWGVNSTSQRHLCWVCLLGCHYRKAVK